VRLILRRKVRTILVQMNDSQSFGRATRTRPPAPVYKTKKPSAPIELDGALGVQ